MLGWFGMDYVVFRWNWVIFSLNPVKKELLDEVETLDHGKVG